MTRAIASAHLDDDAFLAAVRQAIQRLAAHHGLAHIFHGTVTTAWGRLLATHDEPDFDTFIENNAARLTHGRLRLFWTDEALNSPAARQAWVPPDRAPLPTMA